MEFEIVDIHHLVIIYSNRCLFNHNSLHVMYDVVVGVGRVQRVRECQMDNPRKDNVVCVKIEEPERQLFLL